MRSILFLTGQLVVIDLLGAQKYISRARPFLDSLSDAYAKDSVNGISTLRIFSSLMSL